MAVGSARWLPLHLFLAGAVVLAISGVSLMLTVTWSAAPAPPDASVAWQRSCVAIGTVGVTVGRAADAPVGVVAVAGALYLIGLALLAVLLVLTIRRGVERRFDVAVAAYLAAILAGAVGVGLGIAMATGSPTPGVRSAHLTANLLGLVGLTVGGTLPYFAATVGRARLSPHAGARRLASTLAWQVLALSVVVIGLACGTSTFAATGLTAYGAGIVLTMTLLPRPTRRQLAWAGPRLLALWFGTAWWVLAVAASALDAAEARPVLGGRWLAVMVIAGFAQILWGSLAYLLPMLRGGGHRNLADGFATTRSWPGLVAVNTAGLVLALALPRIVASVPIAVWVVDAAWRGARVGTRPAARPVDS